MDSLEEGEDLSSEDNKNNPIISPFKNDCKTKKRSVVSHVSTLELNTD